MDWQWHQDSDFQRRQMAAMRDECESVLEEHEREPGVNKVEVLQQ